MIAFYRMGFSALLLAVPLLLQKRRKIARRDLWLSLGSGLFLAVHFSAWFFSLRLTSVASSTVLVTSHPLMVLAYGYLTRGERTSRTALAGVLVALAGAVLVGWGDFALDLRAFLGDLLALFGGVMVTGYFLIGREVRQRMDAVAYSFLAYAAAAAVLVVAALASGNPLTGFAPVNWWIFLGLALFPTIFGHTLFNWALRFVPASVISVNILGEPIGASILAWLIWRTAPPTVTLAGGLLILAGIALFLRFHPTNEDRADNTDPHAGAHANP